MMTVLRGADDEMDATDQEEVVVDLFSAHEMYEKNYLAWYTRKNDRVGTPFDPSALVRLAAEQWSGMPKVAASFALCTAEWPRSKLYTNFLCDADRAASRYAGGAILEDPNLGVLTVDFVYDPQVPGGVRVSGMEYLDRALGHSGVGTIRWMRGDGTSKVRREKSRRPKSTLRVWRSGQAPAHRSQGVIFSTDPSTNLTKTSPPSILLFHGPSPHHHRKHRTRRRPLARGR